MPRSAHRADAASLRVLAHPTRIELLGLLRERGPQTAALLGDEVDEAPGTVSYHLGKLASAGLIEPAESASGDRRERWWRASHASTEWEPADPRDDAEAAAASDAFQRIIARGYAQRFERYIDSTARLPHEWVAAAALSDRLLHLTLDEMRELRSELEVLGERWAAVSDAHEAGDGAEAVFFLTQAYRNPR